MQRPIVTLCCFLIGTVIAHAIPWPEDYLILEDTKSNGDWYAVIVPTRETAPDDDEKVTDYLANLKTHQVLGKIENAHYFEGRNHFSLSATWSPDNSFVVVEFDHRYGFHAVTLVEISGNHLAQVDLAPYLVKSTPNADACTLYLRMGADRKIRFRVVSTNDPKGLHQETATFGLFQGTYDVAGRRWTVQDGRKLDFDEYELLSNVYDDARREGSQFATPESEVSSLDGQLNDAYKALRLLLPAAKFAKLKAEQVAWLKKLESTRPTDAERIAALRPRVRELEDLLW
jgi:hypothetical protein